jgi:two-component system, chemotaxis family, protein-glutamate methylesterase/glutaminase
MLELPLEPSIARHDVVVIGGSSGSFEAIREILRSLPPELPAAVLIVTHLAPSVSLLKILRGPSALPMKEAASGERLQQGQIYTAVPDAHLLLHDHHLLVRRGPRENLSRPAIDPLFRSAACAFGARVIGVLLSGRLNDGTAGLAAIKTCGGIAVVQDPEDALVPSMPLSALRALTVDFSAPARELAGLITRLTRERAGPTPHIPSELQLEVAIAAQEAGDVDLNEKLGEKSPYSCPDCDGVLWQVHDDEVLRFRCHVGHAVTGNIMLEQKGVSADAVLWRLLRTHEERAALARKLAERELKSTAAADYERRAVGYEEDAAVVRGLLTKMTQSRVG